MKRRALVVGLAGCWAAGVTSPTYGQLKPFVLRVVRQKGWAELMKKEDCLSGTLHVVDPDRLNSDRPGRQIAFVMELPDRSNQNDISAIPAGTYAAFAVQSDKNGPVIQLRDVPKRTAVQFHSGNEISNTEGCLILGAAPVTGIKISSAGAVASRNQKCWIGDSKAARKAVLAEYGWTDLNAKPPQRPITVIVE